MVFFLCTVLACRKLLKEDQLEAGTKAAQQEEMERRKRLEQQRKEFPATAPVVPDSQLGDWPALFIQHYSMKTVFLLLSFRNVAVISRPSNSKCCFTFRRSLSLGSRSYEQAGCDLSGQ